VHPQSAHASRALVGPMNVVEDRNPHRGARSAQRGWLAVDDVRGTIGNITCDARPTV
jgi:hypothetical protein